jgi:polyhydroxybutyrate depolymerase
MTARRRHRGIGRAIWIAAVISLLVAACDVSGVSESRSPASEATGSAASTPPTVAPTATSTTAAAPPSPNEALEPVIDVRGDQRRVRLYVPASPPAEPMPLVVHLHALGESTRDAVSETGWDRLAGSAGLIVAFPPARERAWSVQVTPGLPDDDVDEVFLGGLIDQLVATYPVDARRVYVTGFSMGAVMAGRLACRLSDRVAAVAIVSGTPWVGACTPSRPVSVLIVHGTGDSTFRFARAEAMAGAWRARDACPAPGEPTPIEGGATRLASDGCVDGTAVHLITVQNGRHAWFASPDATDLAWRFLIDHGRSE